LNLNQNYSCTILFTGNIGAEAYEARDKLANLGIKVQIASISNLSEISTENLERILKLGPVLTLEEHVLAGGFGSLILEKANELTTNYRIDRVGIRGIISHLAGSQEFLKRNYELNADAIVKKYLNIIK
jgi:1-deoxy-D-xylulose-5-phosphate synthase